VTAVFGSLDDLRAAVGADLGTSGWLTVGPDAVAGFCRATGVGVPAGGVVPEHLVLSLSNLVMPDLIAVPAAAMGVNYGTGEVRFPAPVPVGSRLRGRAVLAACDDVAGGVQTTIRITLEVAGRPDPACVVDALSRWLA